MGTIPTPAWLKKQNLTIDLYDIVKPRMGYEIQTENDGMIRAVAKEVIQAGYRKSAHHNISGDIPKTLYNELYETIKPRVSMWIQTNRDAALRKVISEILNVGYRKVPEDEDHHAQTK